MYNNTCSHTIVTNCVRLEPRCCHNIEPLKSTIVSFCCLYIRKELFTTNRQTDTEREEIFAFVYLAGNVKIYKIQILSPFIILDKHCCCLLIQLNILLFTPNSLHFHNLYLLSIFSTKKCQSADSRCHS